ncbi:MAG: LptA/OstA family protein [Pseudomonadota bacterium]
MTYLRSFVLTAGLVLAGAALAQTTPFSSFEQDGSQPIEIEAESLTLNQADGTAIFAGGVTAVQGTLTMSADMMTVTYAEETETQAAGIERLVAAGNVFFSTPTETAEGQEADYLINEGLLTLTGGVVLTQGPNALSSREMKIDLTAGTGEFIGGVRTIIVPQSTETQ